MAVPAKVTPAQNCFLSEPEFVFPEHRTLYLHHQLKGPSDPAVVEDFASYMWHHHDALRIVFKRSASCWLQWDRVAPSRALVVHDNLSALSSTADLERAIEQLVRTCGRSLNLEQGPLFQVLCLRLGAREWRLVSIFHHAIMDGLSLKVYSQALLSWDWLGGERSLKEKPSSYLSWCASLSDLRTQPTCGQVGQQWRSMDWEACERAPVPKVLLGAAELCTCTASLLWDRQVLPSKTYILALCSLNFATTRTHREPVSSVFLVRHGRFSVPKTRVIRDLGCFLDFSPAVLDYRMCATLGEQEEQTQHVLSRFPSSGLFLLTEGSHQLESDLLPHTWFNFVVYDDDSPQMKGASIQELVREPGYSHDGSNDGASHVYWVCRYYQNYLAMAVWFSTRYYVKADIQVQLDQFTARMQEFRCLSG